MENAKPLPSEALPQRVRHALQDLAAIRQSLGEATTQANHNGARLNPALDLRLATELERVVDSLRNLLWAYITALSAESGRRPKEVLDWYKMELAADSLAGRDRNTAGEPLSHFPSSFEGLITTALTVTAMHTAHNPDIRNGA